MTEGLTNGYATGELTGGEILPGRNGAGASGSPVFGTTGDVSTLAPTPPGPQPGSSTPPPTPTPAPVDRLDRIAASLRTASASEPAAKATMSNDVATALQMAMGRGLSGADLPDAAYGTAGILRRTSWTPRKSIAYAAGLFAGESGVARGRVLGYVADVFGLSVGKALDPVVMAGYADDRRLGSAVASAPVAGVAGDGWTARDLGAALAPPGAAGMGQGAIWIRDPADVGHLLTAGQGAMRQTG